MKFYCSDRTCHFFIEDYNDVESVPDSAKRKYPGQDAVLITYKIISDYEWRGKRHYHESDFQVKSLWEIASHMRCLLGDHWEEDAKQFMFDWDQHELTPIHIEVARRNAGYYDED